MKGCFVHPNVEIDPAWVPVKNINMRNGLTLSRLLLLIHRHCVLMVWPVQLLFSGFNQALVSARLEDHHPISSWSSITVNRVLKYSCLSQLWADYLMKEQEAEDLRKGFSAWLILFVMQHQQITEAHISIAKEILSSNTAPAFITGFRPGMRWVASNCIEYPLREGKQYKGIPHTAESFNTLQLLALRTPVVQSETLRCFTLLKSNLMSTSDIL